MSDPSALTTALRDAGAQHVLTAEGSGFHAALKSFDTAIELAPDAVVDARSPEDVTAAVEVARSSGAPIFVLGTGHGVLEDVAGGIVVSTVGLAGVEVDSDQRVARVGAGTTWSEVLDAATPLGLAGLCGSAPGVGVVGYLLGGGIGPISRTYGVSADHVRSIEIVTPAEGLITASASENPDLFWALRGGKGGFGIVTSVTIDLFPIDQVYGGALYFAAEHAPAVLRKFVAWAPELPDTTTTSIALLRLPDAPALPDALRGKFVAHVRFASTQDSERAASELAPLLAVAEPLLNTIGELPYARLGEIHGDPTEPMAVVSGGAALSSIGPDVADALLAIGGPQVELPVSAIELRVLGGAIAESTAAPNAVGARAAAGNLFVSGAPIPGARETVMGAVKSVLTAIDPWRGEEDLVNFVGVANDPGDIARSWSAEQNARLSAIRDRSDPAKLFPFGDHR